MAQWMAFKRRTLSVRECFNCQEVFVAEVKVEVGDVVFLKSGSPPMTVFNLAGELIQVCWVTTDGLLNEGRFPWDAVSLRPQRRWPTELVMPPT